MKTNQISAERGVTKRKTYLVWLPLVVVLLKASTALGTTKQEQTTFVADPAERLERPVPVPDAVLRILSKDEMVIGCMQSNPIPSGRSLASWFAVSEIHLNGPNEADLVVLPVVQGSPSMCFHSVEGIGWFWVFRPIGPHYRLVLKTAGLGLSVLDTRHNGYRDIRSGGQVGNTATAVTFRYGTGGRYQEYRRKTTELH
ncbi:MAG TPA: hypothetical protein VEH50_07335 [Methylomirabilota bacterium]|jgi:hypothetical protein|nr:hypothetical protein [Methylomirabilota bacterium]